jgi:ABC-type proline/glycine betaine transport system permease subunit
MEVGRGFEAGISIVFIAIIIDRLTQGVTRSLKKKSGRED